MLPNSAQGRIVAGIPVICLSDVAKVYSITLCHDRVYQQAVADDVRGVYIQPAWMMLTNSAHGRRGAGIPGVCLSDVDKVYSVTLRHDRVYQQAVANDVGGVCIQCWWVNDPPCGWWHDSRPHLHTKLKANLGIFSVFLSNECRKGCCQWQQGVCVQRWWVNDPKCGWWHDSWPHLHTISRYKWSLLLCLTGVVAECICGETAESVKNL